MRRQLIYMGIWIVVLFEAAWWLSSFAPEQHNPFAPLSITDPIGGATADKLKRLKGRSNVCFSTLDAAGIEYAQLEDGDRGDPCAFKNALTLNRSGVPYSARLQMTCPLTAALMVWERQSLRPKARSILGAEIIKVETSGSFSCRRVYGRDDGKYSEHATGNAIDISGFQLSDGRRVFVFEHWSSKAPEGVFLRALHADACRVFQIVLGPDYNAAHADHFHFDLGTAKVCS